MVRHRFASIFTRAALLLGVAVAGIAAHSNRHDALDFSGPAIHAPAPAGQHPDVASGHAPPSIATAVHERAPFVATTTTTILPASESSDSERYLIACAACGRDSHNPTSIPPPLS